MRLYGYFCERRLLEYRLSFVRRLGNRFFRIIRCIGKRLLLFISSVSVLYFSEAVKKWSNFMEIKWFSTSILFRFIESLEKILELLFFLLTLASQLQFMLKRLF